MCKKNISHRELIFLISTAFSAVLIGSEAQAATPPGQVIPLDVLDLKEKASSHILKRQYAQAAQIYTTLGNAENDAEQAKTFLKKASELFEKMGDLLEKSGQVEAAAIAYSNSYNRFKPETKKDKILALKKIGSLLWTAAEKDVDAQKSMVLWQRAGGIFVKAQLENHAAVAYSNSYKRLKPDTDMAKIDALKKIAFLFSKAAGKASGKQKSMQLWQQAGGIFEAIGLQKNAAISYANAFNQVKPETESEKVAVLKKVAFLLSEAAPKELDSQQSRRLWQKAGDVFVASGAYKKAAFSYLNSYRHCTAEAGQEKVTLLQKVAANFSKSAYLLHKEKKNSHDGVIKDKAISSAFVNAGRAYLKIGDIEKSQTALSNAVKTTPYKMEAVRLMRILAMSKGGDQDLYQASLRIENAVQQSKHRIEAKAAEYGIKIRQQSQVDQKLSEAAIMRQIRDLNIAENTKLAELQLVRPVVRAMKDKFPQAFTDVIVGMDQPFHSIIMDDKQAASGGLPPIAAASGETPSKTASKYLVTNSDTGSDTEAYTEQAPELFVADVHENEIEIQFVMPDNDLSDNEQPPVGFQLSDSVDVPLAELPVAVPSESMPAPVLPLISGHGVVVLNDQDDQELGASGIVPRRAFHFERTREAAGPVVGAKQVTIKDRKGLPSRLQPLSEEQ